MIIENEIFIKKAVMVVIIQVILFSGCKIHKNLDFNTTIVSKIEIADIRTINKTDSQFNDIIQFMENQKSDWERPSIGTYPTPRYTFIFYDDTRFLYSLYIGTNWIGTSFNEKQYIKKTDNGIINDFLKKLML